MVEKKREEEDFEEPEFPTEPPLSPEEELEKIYMKKKVYKFPSPTSEMTSSSSSGPYPFVESSSMISPLKNLFRTLCFNKIKPELSRV